MERWIAAAVVAGILSMLSFPAVVSAGRVPCHEVLSELDRVAARSPGRVPGAERIARRLGTHPLWIERCAQIYGRRVRISVPPDGQTLEDYAEHWESTELDEVAPEEKRAQGEVYEGDVKDEKRLPRKFNADAHEWLPDDSMQKPWVPRMQRGWQPTLLDDDM
jgi:hypothetical protein